MENEKYLPPEKTPSGIFSDDGFEVIRSQFFSSSSEPVLSFGRLKMWVNSVCLKKFQETEYIQILVNRSTRTITLHPSREDARDVKNENPVSCPARYFLRRSMRLWSGILIAATV